MSALVVRPRALAVLHVGEPGRLPRPRRLDPRPDRRRWLAAALVAELLERDARDLDVDVDAVEQRAGEPLLVAADDHRAARAGVLRVAAVAARTRILRADEHEIRREGQAALRAAGPSATERRGWSRLCPPAAGAAPPARSARTPASRRLNAVQLGDDAAVRQADTCPTAGAGLARPRPLSAADQPRRADYLPTKARVTLQLCANPPAAGLERQHNRRG